MSGLSNLSDCMILLKTYTENNLCQKEQCINNYVNIFSCYPYLRGPEVQTRLRSKGKDVKAKICLFTDKSTGSCTFEINLMSLGKKIKIQFQILWLIPLLSCRAAALRSPNSRVQRQAVSDLCLRATNNTPEARNQSKWPYGLHIVVVFHYFSSTTGVQSTLQKDEKRRPLLLGELIL